MMMIGQTVGFTAAGNKCPLIAVSQLAALKSAHDALRAKLLPKVYEYGFLNSDVQLFQ